MWSSEGYNSVCDECGADREVKYGPERLFMYWNKIGPGDWLENYMYLR